MAAKKMFRKAVAAEQKTFAPLKDFRELENGNCVLVFDESEVIMPGAWRLQQDLYEGVSIRAWWDSQSKFHLEWEE